MIHVADLFAGAGGCSTGLLMAATDRGERVDLVAVNHWPIAVETHTRNHPEARHFCASVETLDPRVAVPGGKLDLLIAAPECVFFSSARGGRPIDDQRRASAWSILRWLELLDVRHVLIENVPEMRQWGPLGKNHRPLKAHKGETFQAFIAALRSMHYGVEWKVLNAADFGAATTRRRLFIQAWKIPGNRSRVTIHWPEPTHSKVGSATLFGGRKKWRGAREIIDWTLPSQSIFARKKPLQPATIRRILEGLRRFGGPALEPFLVVLRQHMDGRSLDEPVPAMSAGGSHLGLAEPVLVQLTHGGRVRSIDEPVPTLTTANRGEIGIAEPFILGQQSNSAPRLTDDPIPTVAAAGKIALIEPFILGQQSGSVARSVEEPAPTIATAGALSLIEPFIFANRHNNAPKTINEPVPSLCTGEHIAVVEPVIVKYNRTAKSGKPVDVPLDTISTRDRFGLVQPIVNGYALDIRFRMLQPHELAAAMSFPKSYSFAGNKGDIVRQVGNAVDCSMSRALCGAILDARQPRTAKRKESAA